MLQVEKLETVAGNFRLRGVTLGAPSGSYGVLLGPPGSGKSVLVETICGLRAPVAGRVMIDGNDMTGTEPRERLIGYVPQDYLLFPTKKVADNIIYGLRAQGASRKDALDQIGWVVDLLQVGPLLDRWPGTLSGGEQQRVALARAVAIKPRLLLLDEPVSALDEGLREQVCRDLRHFQRELGITTIHISHNLEEALAVSDWAAILDDGELQQCGPMGELLRRPGNEMVARFLRAENVIRATATPAADGQSVLKFAGKGIRVPGEYEGEVTFIIRPELLRVLESGSTDANTIEAELLDASDRGLYQRLEFAAAIPLVAFVPAGDVSQDYTAGRKYALSFPPSAVHVLGG